MGTCLGSVMTKVEGVGSVPALAVLERMRSH
jgi:hypothetical protein